MTTTRLAAALAAAVFALAAGPGAASAAGPLDDPAFHAWSTVPWAAASPSTCSHWKSMPGETTSRS